jgi:hypothetical protein
MLRGSILWKERNTCSFGECLQGVKHQGEAIIEDLLPTYQENSGPHDCSNGVRAIKFLDYIVQFALQTFSNRRVY